MRSGSNPAYPGMELSSRGGLERKGTASLACILGPTDLAAAQKVRKPTVNTKMPPNPNRQRSSHGLCKNCTRAIESNREKQHWGGAPTGRRPRRMPGKPGGVQRGTFSLRDLSLRRKYYNGVTDLVRLGRFIAPNFRPRDLGLTRTRSC